MAGYTGVYRLKAYTGRTSRDEQYSLLLPRGYAHDRTKRGIAYNHGANGDYKQGGSGTTGSPYDLLFQPILSQLRLPIASVDAGGNAGKTISQGLFTVRGGPNTWGNLVAMRSLDNFYTHATTASTNPSGYEYMDYTPGFLNTGGIGLIGFSMGGAVALNWAARNPTLVKFIVLVAPVVNLDDLYTSNRGSFAADIDIGYGAPIANAGTVTGTVVSQSYIYEMVCGTEGGDGKPSAASNTFTGPLLANLGTTPNTITWTWPADTNSSFRPTTVKILRNRASGGYRLNDTIGVVELTASVSGTITSLPCKALAAAIPPNTTIQLYNLDGTSNVAVTVTAAGAAASAVSVPISSIALSGVYNIGSIGLPTKYVDSKTADGAAYTSVTSPWTTNGRNAATSFDPNLNIPAALKAIPCQLWWSANDGVIDAVGTPGTPTTNVQAYKTAYGANCTLKEIPGDPIHANTFTGFQSNVTGGTQAVTDMMSFISANA